MSISHCPSMPNLPTCQAPTQRLVDDFNRDEEIWRKRLKIALKTIRKVRKATAAHGEGQE